MRKFITLLGVLLLASATVTVAQVQKKALQTNAEKVMFQQPVNSSQSVVKPKPFPATDASLYSQMDPASTSGVSTQDFETDFDAYDAHGADDFVVPTGETWGINALRWRGFYSEGGGPCTQFNIRFYADAAGIPGAQIGTTDLVTAVEASGIFLAPLTSTVSLTQGTYWIDIQGRMDYATGGQYYWTRVENTVAIGNEFHWQNPNDGFGTGNTTWTPASIAYPPDNLDLTFELLDALPADPILAVDPESPFDFGNVAMGNTVSQLFYLQNIGAGVIGITDISLDVLSNTDFTVIDVYGVPGNLPSDSISFVVEFTPTTAGVVALGTVNITDNLTDLVTTIDISGKGVIPPSNDECTSPIAITGPYPQTISGTTIDATADCFDDYTVWYTVDLPYDLNLVTVSFCPTVENLGTSIESVYPYLGVDCSCSVYSNDFLDWTSCTANFAPYYEFYWIPGPITATLPITVMDGATDSWELDFQFIVDVQGMYDLDWRVYLEGPYAGAGLMATDLNTAGLIDTTHPYYPPTPPDTYYGNATPVWSYSGADTVSPLPAANIVDWILVQLRQYDPDPVTNPTPVRKFTDAVFLLDDGSIVGRDGSFTPVLVADTDPLLDVYGVVYHRNHLGIMTSGPLVYESTGGTYPWNYTSTMGQVYGGASGHIELDLGIWGMIAADGDADGNVLPADETSVWVIDVNGSGYLGGDYDMNGLGQASDKTGFWVPNANKSGQIPGGKDKLLLNSNQGYKSQIPE